MALLAAAAAAALLGGPITAATAPATLALPLGPPWAGGARLALDGLSAWFLLLLGICGAAASLSALGSPGGEHGIPARAVPPYPLFLGAMAR